MSPVEMCLAFVQDVGVMKKRVVSNGLIKGWNKVVNATFLMAVSPSFAFGRKGASVTDRRLAGASRAVAAAVTFATYCRATVVAQRKGSEHEQCKRLTLTFLLLECPASVYIQRRRVPANARSRCRWARDTFKRRWSCIERCPCGCTRGSTVSGSGGFGL